MMRKLLALLLAAALFAGCTPMPAAEPCPIPGGKAVDGQQGLWYIPNDVVEAGTVTSLLAAGEDLLICRTDEGTELSLISPADGTLLAQTRADTSPFAFVQVLDHSIAVTDAKQGKIHLFDHDLNPLQVLEPGMLGQSWMLSPDESLLYSAALQTGITRIDLQTGAQEQLLPAVQNMMLMPPVDGQCVIAYLDDGLCNRRAILDLTAGTLTEAEGAWDTALFEGLSPLDGGLWMDRGARELTLYDAEGGFLSRCSLPEDPEGRIGTNFVPTGDPEGWFFLDNNAAGSKLMFWCPEPGRGEDLSLAPQTVPEGAVLSRELYDRAEAMSARFDLDIRIADRCQLDYGSYRAHMLTDPELTARAMDILEEALAQYPEGFFSQLPYSSKHSVRIELVDGLGSSSGYDVNSKSSAVTFRRDRYCLIVFDAQKMRHAAVYHEFSHIIDARLAWEANFREDALFSEEAWLALQPEGFAYADSYQNISDEVKAFYDSGYFVRDYACVSATEDRAITLEKAAIGAADMFDANPQAIPKLEYYCACIRDAFDTTGWPEVTFWEQLLVHYGIR